MLSVRKLPLLRRIFADPYSACNHFVKKLCDSETSSNKNAVRCQISRRSHGCDFLVGFGKFLVILRKGSSS